MSSSVFSPIYATQSISATTTSASITLGFSSDQILITNAGTDTCFVIVGTGTQTATTSHLPILPSQKLLITKPRDALTVAARALATTATLYITPGVGETC